MSDDDFGDLLLLIDEHPAPAHLGDSDRVKRAIVDDGLAHDGLIDPNRVRKALAELPVTEQPMHKSVGAAYYALRAAGVIDYAGLALSDDRAGRNAGRPIRTYRLTEAGRTYYESESS